MALGLAGVLALAGLGSSCRSSDANNATGSGAAVPTTAVADVVEDGSQDRVARVANIEGEVSLLPVDADDWETADVNEPVLEGYQVYAADGARGELMLGDAKYARFGDGATFTVARLDPDYAQVELTRGSFAYALDRWADNDYYEISAPGGAIVPQQAGSYRVDVLPDGRTRVVVLRGVAQVTTPDGTFNVSEGDSVDLGYEPAQVNVVAGGASSYRDGFTDWGYQRDTYYQSFNSYDVPQPVRVFEGRNDIYGVIALAAFGVWQALDNDRYVWVPNDARRAGWSPYQNGYWDYSPVVGWNWISSDPWGWAPYHYGRWDYNDRYGWNWAPYYGNQTTGISVWREQYRWQPAEVYFYQPPQANYYAFVPLAPGEAYIPYTVNLRPARDVTVVNYSPRFLREQRAVYVVSPQDLELRARPRKADRVVLDRVRQFADEQQLQVAKLPNPNRAIAANRVAKAKPPKDAAARQVVVTQKSIDRPMKPATERALAREQRQVRKADQKPLKVDRQPVTAGNVQQADRGRAKGGTAVEQTQPQAVDRRAERQAQRQQRQLERQQQAPQVARPDRQAQRQQRQLQRQQQRAERAPAPPKQQRVQPRQPTVQRTEQRALRQQQRAVQQPRAQQIRAPKAERQAVRQSQPRATNPPSGQAKGGKKARP
jgi:hypothetical protein